MARKKTTIEDLAVMVKRGFDHTVTKEEFHQAVTKEEFRKGLDAMVTKEEFRKGLDAMVTKEEFRKEMGELKGQIAHLAADVFRLKEEVHRDDPFVEDLLRRMRVVEKRVGIVK